MMKYNDTIIHTQTDVQLVLVKNVLNKYFFPCNEAMDNVPVIT